MPTDAWIFAYGSLMWDPGFVPAEVARARLPGWRRSFCMWSIHWRGTPEAPGLVLALDADPEGACEGLALKVEVGAEEAVLAALQARELVSDAYEERVLPVDLQDGRRVAALAYVIRRDHRQYARLDPEAQAAVIARAKGLKGLNLDYLANTARHLAELGVAEPAIEALLESARAVRVPPQGLGSPNKPA